MWSKFSYIFCIFAEKSVEKTYLISRTRKQILRCQDELTEEFPEQTFQFPLKKKEEEEEGALVKQFFEMCVNDPKIANSVVFREFISPRFSPRLSAVKNVANKAGWLEKKREEGRRFTKKYMVLIACRLHWYQVEEDDEEPSGWIKLYFYVLGNRFYDLLIFVCYLC